MIYSVAPDLQTHPMLKSLTEACCWTTTAAGRVQLPYATSYAR